MPKEDLKHCVQNPPVSLSSTPVSLSNKRSLIGFKNFVRHNPLTDKFNVQRFHHVEFWCADATNTYKRFQHGLGLQLVAKSDLTTGNDKCASYVLQSGQFVAAFTASMPQTQSKKQLQLQCNARQYCCNNIVTVQTSKCPFQGFCGEKVENFVREHGIGVRAVGLLVEDAYQAYHVAVENGGVGVMKPVKTFDEHSASQQCISEVKLYGDVVLRFVSGDFSGPFLTNFVEIKPEGDDFGIMRMDHCVGNVPDLFETVDYIMGMTGFHELAEFTAEDVGTENSGLNSMVLANNSEYALLPVNEPTAGTRQQSQIQTFLNFNKGPGVQHLALKTNDIFQTLTKMRERSCNGGFKFMPSPQKEYYDNLPQRIGDSLTPSQIRQCKDLGILVDKDDHGLLLQIFTQPVGDRPTIFIEIIQRIGCQLNVEEEGFNGIDDQQGACGGFGKGNFSELFKRIEEFEQQLDLGQVKGTDDNFNQ
eukprot:TRINITY_DN8149_c0_g1_i1.p1 TRINITY_DN8149_c0_g1~~TRINITY_DN8149_c0_g1_i1.p1  ORF type:complete len:475 (+),score=47.86 TRINITY_DN8149_c0_g1_i1:98-1522(+)